MGNFVGTPQLCGDFPQGRYSSSTDATNAWELTAAGWPFHMGLWLVILWTC